MYLFKDFLNSAMSYTTWSYFVLVGLGFALYYLVKKKYQWGILLIVSTLFYIQAVGRDLKQLAVFYLTILISYIFGLLLCKIKGRAFFILSLIISIFPLILVKGNAFLFNGRVPLIVPLGLAFYSLQIYSYLFDIRAGKIQPEENFLRYMLYISFFPQIMQGPIPRYSQLHNQLFDEHAFNPDEISKGFQLILWGFFLKYVIAEHAAIIVNTIFDHSSLYLGCFVLVGGILYSIQLYTDFLACVCMCRGMAQCFGIKLAENFMQPYRSRSIKEFWRRWHISLSMWLKDYVYIPLGGSRKGKLRKYLNLIATFFVSGAWHGNGYHFIAWGLLHAFYQIAGDILHPVNKTLKHFFAIKDDSFAERNLDRVITFFFAMLAWIMFRAESTYIGLKMIRSIFTVYNPWIFWDDSLLTLGLCWKDWIVLIFSVLILFCVERFQDINKVDIRDRILAQPLIFRWPLYIAALSFVIIFGIYGFGFNAADFIYRGF